METEVKRLRHQVIKIKMQMWEVNRLAYDLEAVLHTLQFWERKLAYDKGQQDVMACDDSNMRYHVHDST